MWRWFLFVIFSSFCHFARSDDVIQVCDDVCTCNGTSVNCTAALTGGSRDVNMMSPHAEFLLLLPNDTTSLWLDHNNIEHLPTHLLHNSTAHTSLTMLSLRHNRIRWIRGDDVICDALTSRGSGAGLEQLLLDFNALESLAPAAFENCAQLRTLSLRGNLLTLDVIAAMLPSLPRMTSLDCSENEFGNGDVLPLEFAHAQSLETLSLSRMQLVHLPRDFFTNLANASALSHLDLSGNPLYKLEACAFSNLTSLRSLNIASTHLSSNDSFALMSVLANVSDLQQLDMRSVFVYYTTALRDGGLFDQLSSLTVLHFEGNFGAFQGYLHRPLLAPLHNLEELYLDDNSLQVVHHKSFAHLSHLRVLSLRNNFLPCLTECDVIAMSARLPSLETLDLSGNVLSETAGVISFSKQFFPKLKRVYLRGNRIARLNSDMFDDAPHLQVLDLSENPIQSADANSLSFLKHLQDLKLENCRLLREFPTNFFSKLDQLERLSVRGSALKTISGLELNKNLRYLDLSQNFLTSKTTHILSESVEHLDLSFNQLQDASFLLHSKLTSLRSLILSNNRLTSFNSRYFLRFSSMKILDLSHNDLTSITVDEYFSNATGRLDVLDISGNPFYCDRFINGLARYMRKNRGQIAVLQQVRCAGPPEKKGEKLIEVVTSPLRECGDVIDRKPANSGLALGIFVCVMVFAVCMFLVLMLYCCHTVTRTCSSSDVKHERFMTSSEQDDVTLSVCGDLASSSAPENNIKVIDDVDRSSVSRCIPLTSLAGKRSQGESEALSSRLDSPLMANVFESDSNI